MEVTLLGTGAALPPTSRENTSLAVSWSGGIWLVDTAASPHRRLRQAGLDPGMLRGVLITHDHPDHLYGLPSLIHCMLGDRVRERPLTVIAPPDAIATARRLLEAFNLQARKAVQLDLQEASTGEGGADGPPVYESEGLRIWTEAVEHQRETVGARFEADGRVAAYSSDTGPCDAVVRLARSAGLLVHEATYLEADRDDLMRGHSSGADAGRTAARAEAERLVLVHLGIAADSDPDRLRADAAAVFNGDVDVGEELRTYEV